MCTFLGFLLHHEPHRQEDYVNVNVWHLALLHFGIPKVWKLFTASKDPRHARAGSLLVRSAYVLTIAYDAGSTLSTDTQTRLPATGASALDAL